MTNDRDLILRADSLINPEAAGERRESARHTRRRRSFVASTTQREAADLAAQVSSPGSEEEDLPLLTEVVLPPSDLAEARDEPESVKAILRPILTAELTSLLDCQLSSELPTLIESALQSAGEQLQHAINATITTAMRDFIAQRGQLQLPLEEPVSDATMDPGQARGTPPERRHDPV
ncbi:MAG: hypothetical protein JNK99_09410 [Candidatus Accumulibacter sp.]|jgi:hypothetical protein|uniref:hypothetical protein n=1 Tax=Accumulibacter sp. TaxID=2053492 RepID=UPI001A3D94A8|nr:hypothetical protein [Accumulibacter sp.]MBL8394949.1 hypothetical protein [Accumulibacter sp.]